MAVQMPSDLDLVEIRAQYAAFDGLPLQGTVTFTPSIATLIDPASGVVVLTKPIIGKVVDGVLLNADGSGPLQVFATDDPDLDQRGWTYSVKETLNGGAGRPTYNLTVPVAAKAAGLDLWNVSPTSPGDSGSVSYVLLPAFVTLQARVTYLEGRIAVVDVTGSFPTRPDAALVIWRSATDPYAAGVATSGDFWAPTS